MFRLRQSTNLRLRFFKRMCVMHARQMSPPDRQGKRETRSVVVLLDKAGRATPAPVAMNLLAFPPGWSGRHRANPLGVFTNALLNTDEKMNAIL